MKKCLLTAIGLSANLFLIGCADDQARTQLADTNMRLTQLEQTVGVLGNKVSNQKILDVLNKLDNLQNQIDQLNGNVGTIQHNQQSFQDTQNQVNQGIEQQLQGLGAAPIAGVSSAPVGVNKSVSDSESAQLREALKKIKAHDFNAAIKQLKDLINASKDPVITANASYYLVVAYAAGGQYKDSIFTARKFVEENPRNKNAPDALFTIYISQQQLGMKKSADNTANLIKKNYPDSSAAKKLTK
jgi:TolA-binding protein